MLDTAEDTAVSKEERYLLFQVIVKSGSSSFNECSRCFEQGTVMRGENITARGQSKCKGPGVGRVPCAGSPGLARPT